MSGTRFARTGRCRFLACFCILVIMIAAIVVFHSSQFQLDETREQRLHCEQQQEALNERLTLEQKYHLERNQERERSEQLEHKRNLEEKIKELEERYQKEQLEQQIRYDKLKQTHITLQSEHKHLKEETENNNKQQFENINGLEKKLQSIRSELQKVKFNKSGELEEWKEKYDVAASESSRLSKEKQQLQLLIKELEQSIKNYQSHCEYKLVEGYGKSVAPKSDVINHNTSEKSFQHQDSVSEGVYHISLNISSNKETKKLNGDVGDKNKLTPQQIAKTALLAIKNPLDTNNDTKQLSLKLFKGGLILNSVENFQIVPKSIKHIADDQQEGKPHPQTSLVNEKNQILPLSAPKSNNQFDSTVLNSEPHLQALPAKNVTGNVRTSRGSNISSSNTSTLTLPPNPRKLPENVAPIPENFDYLFQKYNKKSDKTNDNPSQLDENRKRDLNVNKSLKLVASNNNNYDSGAHEIKDAMAEDTVPNIKQDDDIKNFLDGNQEPNSHNENKNKDFNDGKDDIDNDNDGELGADDGGNNILSGIATGDIAVKHDQNQQLVDDSLRNEIADDQGKEFGDGLRLDEGAIEEDDDDDYSNPSARKQIGGQTIRN